MRQYVGILMLCCEKLLAFAGRYGSGRLSAEGLSLLRTTVEAVEPISNTSLDIPVGNRALARSAPFPFNKTKNGSAAVAVALEGNKLAGFAFAVDAGERACIVVIRPDLRGCGAGSALLTELRQHYGHLSCSVAIDNPASMQMCFRAGMTAVGMHRGPTGKPTLRFTFSR